MSNHKDNNDKQNLKDLLNKKNQPEESFDAFEQEALEGFAMLENDTEAFDLKEKLDAKIYSEVFHEEKKSSQNYWFAAAGLFLVIGFSIYFFKSMYDPKKEELAIETTSGDKLQKSIEQQTLKNQDLQFEAEESAKSEGKTEFKTPVKETEIASMADSISQPAAAKPIQSNYKSDELASSVSKSEPQLQAAPMSVPEQDAAPGTPAREQMEEAISEKKSRAKMVVKKEEEAADKDVLIVSKDAKKSKAGEDKRERIASDDAYAPSASSGAIVTKAMPEIMDEATFKKELKEKMTAKNLSGKFDATLVLDVKNKVDKIVFTNAFDFTVTQQKEIEKIIKDLKSLKFKNESASVGSEYDLKYWP